MSSDDSKTYRGIDIGTETYYIGKNIYQIRKDGHLPLYTDKVETLAESFKQNSEDFKKGKISEKDALFKSRDITRQMLKICLVGNTNDDKNEFDYDKALAENGYVAMDNMAVELKTLFLEIGGLEEYQLLLKQAEAMHTGLNGSKV